MNHLKQGRRGNPCMVKYAAPRKATAGGGGKPSSLKDNTGWKEITRNAVDTCLYPRGQPIGNETVTHETIGLSPDRVFKVVLLGNSGVGKSSFIHRFCYNRFMAKINATVGIDYQVKSLMVDNTQVLLQLWDTAGQERFQSVTKQYFRRVDGILVMYDITAECSFVAVRNWMTCVQDRIEDGAVVFLLGNKMDASDKKPPNVSRTEGERLAKEYQAVFYECSAMTGYNILEPMLHMARAKLSTDAYRHENQGLTCSQRLDELMRRAFAPAGGSMARQQPAQQSPSQAGSPSPFSACSRGVTTPLCR
uniref:EF-hand calcium-binding domain-containing protein 4B-like n=1 Tax=Euleptes europaea TaxID=460621 RepID=UPI0025403465|nr:EF-hand calcium-binding domain-containing protein 4B-like [Euleptes europaea]